jgi:hypothetical protein
MGVMDIFYNKNVSIYTQQQSEPNDLGIVEVELVHITDSKAVSNPLTVQQAKERYGLNTSMSVEYTIEYFEEVYQLIANEQVLFIVDGNVRYKVESANVYEQFYVLDACISVAVTRSDV